MMRKNSDTYIYALFTYNTDTVQYLYILQLNFQFAAIVFKK